ncbi:MAG: T9SS type A sorting domain-containing protein [Polaribacter sp.]
MKKLLLLFLTITSINSFSQATLVADINKGNGGSTPKQKVLFNGFAYFPANDGVRGSELWRTDGTEAGTTFFKEFETGLENGLTNLIAFTTSNTMYFFAWDGTTNNALWKTDGTAAGTVKLKTFSGKFAVTEFVAAEVANGIVFRARIDNGHSLWTTDGTEAGTIKLSDIDPTEIVKLGNKVFFAGDELWETDGTVAGTLLFKDISSTGVSVPRGFNVINSTLIFIAHTAATGREFWKSDGTESGTVLVKDIVAGSNGLATRVNYEVYNNELYFEKSGALWKTDGTDAGTVEVKSDLGIVKKIFNVNNKIIVIAYNSSIQKQVIWVSDGTNGGTTNFNPDYTEFAHNSEYGVVGNELFFQANSPTTGYELWKTDGTETGTFLVKDIHPTFDDNNIEDIIDFNGKAIFTASDQNWFGKEIYISDGTEAGTKILKDINTQGNNSSSPQNYFQFGNKILFSADNGENGRELWMIENGTASLLKDINPGHYYSNPTNFIELNGEVYFYASTSKKGKELWKTDGTAAGTILVKDINPNEKDGVSNSTIAILNSKIYFFGNDGTTGLELFESDGSTSGTKVVSNINGTATNSMSNSDLVVLNNELFFAANNGTNGSELFKSDGTLAGTVLVKDINTNGGSGPISLNVHPYLNKLYFSAYDGNSTNLWVTEGAENNTFKQQVKSPSQFKLSGKRDIGSRGNPNIIYNTELFFSGESSSNFNKKGRELWAITYTGTIQQVFDINSGTASSSPSVLTDVNGTLYFVANNGTNGKELWKANGVASAEMVKDIVDGTGSVQINNIGSLGDTVFFNAPQDPVNVPFYDYELWVSDGTENGTKLFQDINPSKVEFRGGSNPRGFFKSGDKLFFSADNGTTGYELYMLEQSALSTEDQFVNSLAKASIYPNPTSAILNIKVDNQEIKEVKIFNLLGKEVQTLSVKNENINKINISHLPNGMYILQVKTDADSYTKKIIKN